MNAAAHRYDGDVSGDDDGVSCGAGSTGKTDLCSRAGAQALKAKIEAYWLERGHTVMIVLHNVGFHPAIRAARFDVRSDMVNGMPRARRSQKPALTEAMAEDRENSDDDLVFE